MDKKEYLCDRVVLHSKAQHISEFALSLNRYHKITTLILYSETQSDTVFLIIRRKDTKMKANHNLALVVLLAATAVLYQAKILK